MKKWFYGKPRREGFYWYKKKSGDKIDITHFDGSDYELGFTNMGYDGPVGLEDFGKGTQWLGPIEPPVMTENA